MAGFRSELPRKNCQWFLSTMVWDHQRMRDKLQKFVAKEHAGRHSVGVIDEMSDMKKGRRRRASSGSTSAVSASRKTEPGR